jgi:hypothetical protein
MSIEAMKQALEALRNADVVYMEQLNAMYALQQAIEFAEMVEKGTKAWADTTDGWVDDLRGGVEKIVPSDYTNSHQPVAWINKQELAYMSAAAGIGETQWKTNLGLKPEPGDVPLYTAPLPPIYTTPIPPSECQTEEEKRAFAFGWWKAMEKKKQWVGLTDEERKLIIHEWRHQEGKSAQLCQAIEAKLREKNT